MSERLGPLAHPSTQMGRHKRHDGSGPPVVPDGLGPRMFPIHKVPRHARSEVPGCRVRNSGRTFRSIPGQSVLRSPEPWSFLARPALCPWKELREAGAETGAGVRRCLGASRATHRRLGNPTPSRPGIPAVSATCRSPVRPKHASQQQCSAGEPHDDPQSGDDCQFGGTSADQSHSVGILSICETRATQILNLRREWFPCPSSCFREASALHRHRMVHSLVCGIGLEVPSSLYARDDGHPRREEAVVCPEWCVSLSSL